MAKHEISKPSATEHVIATNGVNVYHRLEIDSNQVMSTGQPFVIHGTDRQHIYDMLYSTAEFDQTEEFITTFVEEYEGDPDLLEYSLDEKYVLVFRDDITWSVNYTLEDSNNAIAALQSIIPEIKLSTVKHPSREEYALPWSDYIMNNAPDGDIKNQLFAMHDQSVADGDVRTDEEFLAEGWFG